jgi:cell division transport system ATP-binding protein
MNSTTPATSEPIIEIRKAGIYQKNHLVLADVSMAVNKGEFIYLIGRTGSGKSSLLRTLYGDLILTEGDGKIAGYDLRNIKEKDIPFLRRKLGIVFQDFQLLTDRDVEENLMFVLKSTGWKNKQDMQMRIKDVLAKVGLSNKDNKMPHQLSGGEQQRVAIARALLNNPDVILADEPTGNLDPETSEGIMRLMFDISKSGTAIVMASHDYALFSKFPSRIIKCENGRILDSQAPGGIPEKSFNL